MEKLLEKFNNKKMIENLVVFLILAVIVMIVINTLFKSDDEEPKENIVATLSEKTISNNDNDLEKRLENILSLISGAGEVKVMVSYLNEVEKIPMTDMKTTNTVVSEKDSGGGERKTEETSIEESIIYEENSGSKVPVIKQNILPEIIGVIVVASGANNMNVKENLIKAVEATVDVPSHRIQVFAK